jgi:hypothetical protein
VLYIDGKWETASSGRTFDSRNPANGEKLGEAADADRSRYRTRRAGGPGGLRQLVAYHRVRAFRPAL